MRNITHKHPLKDVIHCGSYSICTQPSRLGSIGGWVVIRAAPDWLVCTYKIVHTNFLVATP